MKKFIMYVGLDVHKNSIEVAFADAGRDGEVRSYGKIDGNLTAAYVSGRPGIADIVWRLTDCLNDHHCRAW
jgi:hypothetical protein